MANKRLFLSPPHLGSKERVFLDKAITNNYVAPLGPMVDAFEEEFGNLIETPHCLALSSGTAAMHLALRHLYDESLKEGRISGEKTPLVLASTLTFIGSITPIHFINCEPVFIDCDLHTWNLDPALLEEELESCRQNDDPVLAVIPTDLYGQCCNVPALRKICDQYQVPLIIDSAESLGARYKNGNNDWQSAGRGGRCAIYSFNGNKIITTGGGGMLASDDEELINHARKLSQQAREPVSWYEHQEIGYNYRLSNILAAIGRGQLLVLSERVRRKREIFKLYQDILGDVPGISFMPEAEYNQANRWLTVIQIDPLEFGSNTDTVRESLEADNLESRPLWKPMHKQPVFNNCRIKGGNVSEDLFRKGLCLPSGTAMSNDDIHRICEKILTCKS